MFNKRIIPILIVIFVDIVGFGFILPLLPFYAEIFGASATTIGFLFASYALAQFLAVPIFGKISDTYGRKLALMISTVGDFIGFLMFGLANSIFMLFAGRIISGMTGSNYAVAQAYISDVTKEEERSKSFGLLGATFGLGFIVGPFLGGVLSIWGIATPALVAAGVSFLNLIAIYLFLPESLNKRTKTLTEKSISIIPDIRPILQSRKLTALFSIDAVFGFAFIIFQATFSLYSQYRFGLSAQAIGYMFAYIGVLIVFVQGYLVGKLLNIFPERSLVLASTVLMSFSLMGWALTQNIFMLLLILIPLSLSGGIYEIVISSIISKSIDKDKVGEMLGISSSLDTFSRIIAPILGGFLFQFFGTSAPGIFATLLTLGILIFIIKVRWVTECKKGYGYF
ncbi:MAG: major facilitator transporter [uncultured bacterium]|nr:MAG: major facilitator transporter [uncultured bacterium]HBH18353.1 MFS transporter [Cyanobacteria bacterium UBA9579]